MNTTIFTALAEQLIGPDKVLDVRELPCSIKHGLILRTCLELPVGDHFILLNSRDPAHLREEIPVLWPEAFGWEYLVRNSYEVRAKITKLKAVDADTELPPAHECSH